MKIRQIHTPNVKSVTKRFLVLFTAVLCLGSLYASAWAVIYYKPDTAAYERYVAFMQEYDAMIAAGDFDRLEGLIDDDAVFEYVFIDKYGRKTKQYMDKTRYLDSGMQMTAGYQTVPEREILSYSLYNENTEVFMVSYVRYKISGGSQTRVVGYREHLHLFVEDQTVLLTGIYSENNYDRFYPLRP